MGSAGLEFDAADGYSAARLNQKTTFVGTGAQINALSTTYPGQKAFCTSTGSGFTADKLYVRNSANDAWNLHQMVESSEGNSTPVTDNADDTITAGRRYYAFYTFPTTDKFYIVTGIEWKNGATVSGNIQCGVDVVNADPPTVASTPLLVLATEVAQAGTSAVQRNSNVVSRAIKGGTIVGIWVSGSSGTATLRHQTGLGSQNQYKATSYSANPGNNETTAWTATTTRKYLKLYYVGYS